ncbi:MAG: PilZ domain-containing protein [Gammaproteobacteria bacterium]|nr:PilZ domain-containing protein [Gammaproteobacteria bacterium]
MTSHTPEIERRQYKRIPFIAEVLLGQDDHQWHCRLMDISLKGMLIEHVEGAPSEGSFDVSLVLSEDVAINMQASISHCSKDYCGLVWKNIELEGLTHLRRLLELNMSDAEQINRELAELG